MPNFIHPNGLLEIYMLQCFQPCPVTIHTTKCPAEFVGHRFFFFRRRFSSLYSSILRKMDAGHKQVHAHFIGTSISVFGMIVVVVVVVTQTILQRKIASMDGILKWDNLAIYYGSKIEETNRNAQHIRCPIPSFNLLSIQNKFM